MTLKSLIKKITPNFVLSVYRLLKAYRNEIRYKITVRTLVKNVDVYNVLFFLEISSLWKYHHLYNLLKKSNYFKPTIVVCPNITKSSSDMLRIMYETYNDMLSNGYNVLLGYNEETQEYINVRNLNPHIIFFTNSWEFYLDKRFHIKEYSDVLTCYMNYSFVTTPHKWSFATEVSTNVWRYFQECEEYNRILKQWTPGRNALVTGYPMYDEFVHSNAEGKDWKKKESTLKRVIYAPHHSIFSDGFIALSTFLIHAEAMLEITKLYKDKIQFVFKPHPHLRNNLYKHSDWGVEKTDNYYNSWINGENTAFVNGEYIDLFKSSDAMIHDCSSFTVEYLYTKKPVCFLSNIGDEGQANEVALRAYDAHYKAKTKADICIFLDNVVIGGVDEKLEERECFYNEVLLPFNSGEQCYL